MPQVHGTVYEAIEKLRSVVETEINSTTDNPLFDFENEGPEGELLFASGANFHGQPLAVAIDYLKIALTSLGLMTDKRTFSLLDEKMSYGLPAGLAHDTSKADGGLMICQYAGAARAAENRILSGPASITSVSTSANQEDFVSMGSFGALHLQKVIYNVQTLVGIEVLCALRGLQMTYDKLPENLQGLGKGTQLVFDFLSKEENLPPVFEDRYLRLDMERAIELVNSQQLLKIISNS